MKTGSLVVCVDDSYAEFCINLVKDRIYTIRGLELLPNGYGVFLEEIVNGLVEYTDGISEPCYRIERFRELDTPTEIKLEEILELELV